MLLAAGTARGDETATRTDRVAATIGAGSTFRLDNVSGDVIAVPGSQFAAVATVVVTADDRRRAEDILQKVRIVQLRNGNDFTIEARWPESRWILRRMDRGPATRRMVARCEDCRINARFEVTIPPGVTAVLGTVNGSVRVRDVDGDLRLSTVNGAVQATGVRRSLTAARWRPGRPRSPWGVGLLGGLAGAFWRPTGCCSDPLPWSPTSGGSAALAKV